MLFVAQNATITGSESHRREDSTKAMGTAKKRKFSAAAHREVTLPKSLHFQVGEQALPAKTPSKAQLLKAKAKQQ